MAVNQLWIATAGTGPLTVRARLFYDDVALALQWQCDSGADGVPASGTGTLTLTDNTGNRPSRLVAVAWDQFADALAHVIAGPGAIGTDTTGAALPTKTVPATTVARVARSTGPPATAALGPAPTILISLAWTAGVASYSVATTG